jgi:protease IV
MKKFLLGILCGFVFAGLAAIVFFFAIVRFASKSVPETPAESMLVLRLEGEIGETPGDEMPLPWLDAQTPLSVIEIRQLLERAATDSKIKALLLEPARMGGGWAKSEEIRNQIAEFKKSGKPVYAFLRTPNTKDYFLASVADRISIVGEDHIDLKGLRAERMYYKGTLDKLGVQMEVVHAGKFKDFGDSYTKTAMSPESRESLNALLDGIYSVLVNGIASGRKRSAEEVKRLIDGGPYLAKDALAAKLVDSLEYENQTFDELARKANISSKSRTSAREYRKIVREAWTSQRSGRVAYLVAEGDIIRGDLGGFGDGGMVASRKFIREVETLRKDDNYSGVVLRIDSPGGDAIASDELLAALRELSKAKPMVVSMSDVAASGGYYMAVTGDPITAYPSTITGSIGVVYGKPNVKGLYDKLGLSKDMLKRGQNADIDVEDRPLSEVALKKLREGVDESYRSFLERVAEGRKAKVEEIAPLAEGRAWVANDPNAKRLTDQLTGLTGAVTELRKKMNLKPEDRVRLTPYPAPDSAWRKWLGDADLGAQARARLAESLLGDAGSVARVEAVRRALRPALVQGGMLRWMPYAIEVK